MEERQCGGGFAATPLMRAARDGNVSMIEAALECSAANLDAVDAHGHTALMIACIAGHHAAAKALAEAGCDMDAVDGNGHRAADIAANNGQSAISKMLSEQEAKRARFLAAAFGTSGPGTGHENVMDRLLREAGLPKGSNESPF